MTISGEILFVQCSIVICHFTRQADLQYTAAGRFSHIATNKGETHEIRIDANPHRRDHGYVGHVSSGSFVRKRTGGPDRSGRPGTAAADGGRGFYERPGAQRYSG